MKRIISAVVVSIGLAAPAWAGFDEGVAAYERGDYATALREFRPLADQGDAAAQYNLGIMYSEGRGVQQGDAEAVRWFRKAAPVGRDAPPARPGDPASPTSGTRSGPCMRAWDFVPRPFHATISWIWAVQIR